MPAIGQQWAQFRVKYIDHARPVVSEALGLVVLDAAATFLGGTALNVNCRTTFQAHETFNHHVSDSQSQQTEFTNLLSIMPGAVASYSRECKPG